MGDANGAHPGARGGPQCREEPAPAGGAQKYLELVGGPRALLDLRDGAHAWRMGDERDVAGHEAASRCVGERAADDEVDLLGGWCLRDAFVDDGIPTAALCAT